MKKFTICMPKGKLQFTKKKQKSAALIIALMIVTTASIIILGTTRSVVTSTFTSNRFGDIVIANNLAWSGIENGLWRLKTEGTSINTVSYPTTFDSTKSKVVRRNVSAGTVESESTGIDYTNDVSGSKSDQYYDLRVASSDNLVGKSSLPAVNLGINDNPILNTGYYSVSNTEGETYRIFDLSGYNGNHTSGGASTNLNQKIAFIFNSNNLATIGAAPNNISLDFYVYYTPNEQSIYHDVNGNGIVDPTPPDFTKNMNAHLNCHDPVDPWSAPVIAESLATGNYFKTTSFIVSETTSGKSFVYIPAPCDGGVAPFPTIGSTVQYVAVKIKFNGTAAGRFSYGLRMTNATADPAVPVENYAPNGGYLGTGLTTIASTGLFSNVKKTVELWAAKDLTLNAASIPLYTNINALECASGTAPLNVLNNCRLKVYRDNKY